MYCFFFRSPFLSAVSLRSDRSFCYIHSCTIFWIVYINLSNFVWILLYVCYDFSLIRFSLISLGVQITKQHSFFYTLFYHISIFFINSYSFHSIYFYFTFFNFLRILAHPHRPPFEVPFTKSHFFSFFLSNTLLLNCEYAFFNVFLTFHLLLVFVLY